MTTLLRPEKNTGDGWAISSSYTAPFGVGVIGSYTAADRTNTQTADGHGKKAEAWATGLKYDANNIYVATTYGEYHNLSYKKRSCHFCLRQDQGI
ncbi:hypothetical protein DZJ_07830 [Dickeya ananatis]